MFALKARTPEDLDAWQKSFAGVLQKTRLTFENQGKDGIAIAVPAESFAGIQLPGLAKADFRLYPKAGDLGKKGRFLRVTHIIKGGYLHLAEVQVFAGKENLALKGKAKQISTGYDGPAKYGNDGNVDILANVCSTEADIDDIIDQMDNNTTTDNTTNTTAPTDADNDGVTDLNDTCPNTPTTDLVNANGCTIIPDTDGDGIDDDVDECPSTQAGTDVDNVGCPAPEAIEVSIGLLSPQSGELSEFSESIERAADLAVNRMNDGQFVYNFT